MQGETNQDRFLLDENAIRAILELAVDRFADSLVPSATKNEYCSVAYLEIDIENHLVDRGRVNIFNLSEKLNLDVDVIKDLIQNLVEKSQNGNLIVVLGDLLSSDYLLTLQCTIESSLQSEGYLLLSDACLKHSLPADFMQYFFDSFLQAHQLPLSKSTLVTPIFLQTQSKLLRSVLESVVELMPCSRIISQTLLPDSIAYGLLEEIVKTLPGKIKNRLYIPESYIALRLSTINEKLSSCGYVEMIRNNDEILSGIFRRVKCQHPDAILVGQYLFLESFFTNLDASVEAALTEDGYADLTTLVPHSMSESLVSDIMLRLESSSNSSERVKVGSKIILMISHCSSVLEKLQLWAFRLATNDDERRARIGKAKPTYRSKEEVYLHHEDIKAELMNLNSNLPSTLLDYLAQKAMPTLNALYRQQLSAVFVTTPTAIEFSLEHKTAAKTLLRTKLLSSWERFLLCSAGTQHFDDSIRQKLTTYLLSTIGSELSSYNLLYCQLQRLPETSPCLMDETGKLQLILSAEEYRQILNRLSLKSDTETSLGEMSRILNYFQTLQKIPNLPASTFMETIEALDSCDLDKAFYTIGPNPPPIALHLEATILSLETQLKSSTEPALILHICALISFQVQNNCLLQASGKFVPAILSKLKNSALLKKTAKLVMSIVRKEVNFEDVRDHFEQVRDYGCTLAHEYLSRV